MSRIRLPLALFVFLASTGTALARLGETIDECEARYGEIRERIKPQFPLSDEYAIVFIKSGIRIVIEYKDEKAWKLNYEGGPDLAANFAALLRSNNDDQDWGGPMEVFGKKFWVRPDAKAHAVGITESNRKKNTLTVVDDDFLKARAASYQARLERAADIRSEYLNQANPLPGF